MAGSGSVVERPRVAVFRAILVAGGGKGGGDRGGGLGGVVRLLVEVGRERRAALDVQAVGRRAARTDADEVDARREQNVADRGGWVAGLVRGPDHLLDRRDGAAVGTKGGAIEADNPGLAGQTGQDEGPPLPGGGLVQLPSEDVLVGGDDLAGDADGAGQGLGVRCFVVRLAFGFGG